MTTPTVSLAAVSSPSNDTTPGFSGTSSTELGDGDVKVEIHRGATFGGELVATTTATRNSETGAWTAESPATLTQGAYNAVAVHRDGANHVASSERRVFTVDTTAPALTLNGVGSLINTATPTFTGQGSTAAGDLGTITVRVYRSVDPTVAVRTLTGTRDATTGAYSIPTTPGLLDSNFGSYTAVASQDDSAGNIATTATTFRIDTQPPASADLEAPAAGLRTADATPSFVGSGSDLERDDDFVTVKVYAGDGVGGAPVAELNGSLDGDSAFEVSPATALADGTYTVQVEQRDAAGNAAKNAPRTFTVDTTGPQVTLAEPAAVTSPTFSGVGGTATGDQAGVTIKVVAGDPASGPALQTLVADRDGTTGAYSAAAATLVPGTYTVLASQADDLGNTSTASRVLTVPEPVADPDPTPTPTPTPPAGTDATPTPTPPAGTDSPIDRAAPVISGVAVSKRKLRSRAGKATLGFTLGETAAFAIAVTRAGKVVGRPATATGTGPVKVKLKKLLGRKALRRGRYEILIVAVDGAGNRSQATVRFRVVRR